MEEDKNDASLKRKKKLNDDEDHNSSDDDKLWMPKAKFTKLVEFYRETDVKDVVKKSEMFRGMEFYIVNVDDKVANKPFLESRIVEHGGSRV